MVILECKKVPLICVEASAVFELSHSMCLQNWHLMNTKTCLQLELYQGSIGPWQQRLWVAMPLNCSEQKSLSQRHALGKAFERS